MNKKYKFIYSLDRSGWKREFLFYFLFVQIITLSIKKMRTSDNGLLLRGAGHGPLLKAMAIGSVRQPPDYRSVSRWTSDRKSLHIHSFT